MDFTFSDTIAGYVTDFDPHGGSFGLDTTDGRKFRVKVTATTYAEIVRNLGEPYEPADGALDDLLVRGRYLFVQGIFYPDGKQPRFEAKHIVLQGQGPTEYRFEEPDWWINQIRELGDFYLNAQFPDGVVDFRDYRTELSVEGQKSGGTRQETDTISRVVYGFATAFMLTGDDRYLEAAELGTEYLREHMRVVDTEENVAFWYHGIDVSGGRERKVLASQFGDDYDAIPAYEQIYALAGPVQTYRITGDERILHDAELTVSLFDRFFLDRDRGGYFSHVDPVNFDPRSPTLGADRARKNWNSIGDHAPAYLINLYLATGDERYAEFLAELAEIVTTRFPDFDRSPFVQERFHEDWSPDSTWGWQRNRAVVGHNLKIAWNLMRIHHLRPDQRYVDLATKIADIMPTVGMDVQRGGWYDVMERARAEGEEHHRLVWHDRKAWWQQEQAILAYLILTGSLGSETHLRMARESEAYYNAWFPDHDSGAVYFNVLAGGMPYLLGTERLKGSHSMSGYHSFELCYLAAVYGNLLIRKQPMDLYFRPHRGAFPDGVLRVQPDLLPPGSVQLQDVWIDDERWTDFDPEAMSVRLPGETESTEDRSSPGRPPWSGTGRGGSAPQSDRITVRVRIAPARLRYGIRLNLGADVAELVLDGELDEHAQTLLRSNIGQVIAARPAQMVLRMEAVRSISKSSARALVFACQPIDVDTDIFVVGANDSVRDVLSAVGFLEQATAVRELSEVVPLAVAAAATGPTNGRAS
jgi:anti-anti-sigma factor